MALRDTTWVLDTAGNLLDSNANIETYQQNGTETRNRKRGGSSRSLIAVAPSASDSAHLCEHVRSLGDHGDLRLGTVFGQRLGHGHFDALRAFDEQLVDRLGW